MINLLLAVSGTFWLHTRIRREEIGIRLSYGAFPEGICRMLIRKAFIMTTIAVFVGCFFLLFYYSALFIDRDRQKVEWTTHHLPQYNKAIARWEHLSYCQRCDVVWLDNEPGRLAEVEDTEKLLNA